MAGKYNGIMLIAVLVFSTFFMLLYASESVRSSIPTIPTLTEVQAIEVMKVDIHKRVGNVSVSIYGKDSRDPNFSGEPLSLFYYRHGDNVIFRINGTSHTIMAACDLSIECFQGDKRPVLGFISGRLVYFVDGSYSGDEKSSPAYYFVDAVDGDILWSYIGEDVYPELAK